MTANTAPIFALTPNVKGVNITAANTKSDGTGTGVGTDIFKAFIAGSNGSWVSRVRFNPVATTANTATTATIGRVFVSSISSGATIGGTDTFLVAEVALVTQNADHSTAPTMPVEVPLGFALQTGWFIHCTTHAAPAASTDWQAVVYGGDY